MATKFLGTAALTKLVEKIKAVSTAIPTKLSQLTNDSGYQTSSQVSTTVTNATKDLAAKTEVTAVDNKIGDLADLDTDNTSIVNGLNDVWNTYEGLFDHVYNVTDKNIGTKANLTTVAKTDLVSAINEVDSNVDNLQEIMMTGYYTKAAVDTKIAESKAGLATETYVNNKVSSVYKYKGSKDTYASLPATGNTVGDVWNVVDKNGQNFAWTGSAWDALGETIDLSGYMKNDALQEITAAEVEALFN